MRQATDAPNTSELSLVDRVRNALLRKALVGEMSLAAVAAHLEMSKRTLQRRLNEQGTGLVELVASVQSEAAKELLRNGHTAAEVSRRLGFSAPSAFHRAFLRSTGITAGQYRRSHRDGAGLRGASNAEPASPADKKRVPPKSRHSIKHTAKPTKRMGKGDDHQGEATLRKLIGEIGLARSREVLLDIEQRMLWPAHDVKKPGIPR